MLPSLQMVTQFLKPGQMPPVLDSLLAVYTLNKLPDTEVDPRKGPRYTTWLPVFRRQLPPEAEMLPALKAMFQAGIPLRHYVEETLENRLHFMLRCDQLWRDGPIPVPTLGMSSNEYFGSPGQLRIDIRLNVDQIWPLLHPGYTRAEKAAVAFLIANTLLHELGHAVCMAIRDVFTTPHDAQRFFPQPHLQQFAKDVATQIISARGPEPYFEETQWSEMGILIEGETFGGQTIPIWLMTGGVRAIGRHGLVSFPLARFAYPAMPLLGQMQGSLTRAGYVMPRSRFAAAVPYKWATRFFRRDLYDVARRKFGSLAYKASPGQPFTPIGSTAFPNAFADLPSLLSQQWSRAILTALSNGNYWATYNWVIMVVWECQMCEIVDKNWLLHAANWPQGFDSLEDSRHGTYGIRSCSEHLRALIKLSIYLSLPEQSRFYEWWSRGQVLPISRAPDDHSISRRDFDVYENTVTSQLRNVTLAQQLLLGETLHYFSTLSGMFAVIMAEYLKLRPWEKQMLHYGQGNLPPGVAPDVTNRGTKFWTEMMGRSHKALANVIYLYDKIDMHIPEIAPFFGQDKLPRLLEIIGLCAEAMSPQNVSRYPDSTYKLNSAVWLEQNLPELPSSYRRDLSDVWRPLAIYEMKSMEPDAKDKLRWFFHVNATVLPNYAMMLVSETDADSKLSEIFESAPSGLGGPWKGGPKKSIFGLQDTRIGALDSEQGGTAIGTGEGAKNIMQACNEASGSFPFTAQDAELERQFQEYQPDPNARPDPMDPKTMKGVVSEALAAESRAGQRTAPHPDTLLPKLDDDVTFVKQVQSNIRRIFRPPPGARAGDQWVRDILESRYKPHETGARPEYWPLDPNSTYDNLFTSDQTPEPPPALRGSLPAQPSAFIVPKEYRFQVERAKQENFRKSMLRMQQALRESPAAGFAKHSTSPRPFAEGAPPQLTAEQFQAMLTANRDKLPRESRHLGFDRVMAGYATRVRFESGEKRGKAEWGSTSWDTPPFPDPRSAESTISSDVVRLGVDVHDRTPNFLTNPRDLPSRPWRMNRIRVEERDRGDGDWSTERYLGRQDLLGIATATDPDTRKSLAENPFIRPQDSRNIRDYRTPRDEFVIVEGEEYADVDPDTGLSRWRDGRGRRRSASPKRF